MRKERCALNVSEASAAANDETVFRNTYSSAQPPYDPPCGSKGW